MGKTILEATVVDIEKRRYPSKHYVYVIEVVWSEGTRTKIYRRYSSLFEFQCGLLERFPIHAGNKNPADRCIPFLPGKKIFGRSHVRSVAEKRMGPISDYCKALIRLPSDVSEDSYLLNFFEVTQDDLNPPKKLKKEKKNDSASEISDPILLEQFTAIADYQKQKNAECSLKAGQIVEVIDKNENGWWFVHMDDLNEGWVPATYLEPIYGENASKPIILEPGEEEFYISNNGYTAKKDDEISFERGVLLEVFQKGMDGWWKARYLNNEGFVPACYLNRYYGSVNNESICATQIVSTAQEAIHTTLHKPAVASKGISKINSFDDEPIYAPTPRKESVQRFNQKPVIPRITPMMIGGLSTLSNAVSTAESRKNESSDEEEVFHDYETLSEHYVTIAEFKSNVDDGLSFPPGVEVSVITKNPSGWWFVEMNGKEGWVPSSYLERILRPLDDDLPKQKHIPSKLTKPETATFKTKNSNGLPSETKPGVAPRPKTTFTKPELTVKKPENIVEPIKPSVAPRAKTSNYSSKAESSTKKPDISKPLGAQKLPNNTSAVLPKVSPKPNLGSKSQSSINSDQHKSSSRGEPVPLKSSLRRSSSSDSIRDIEVDKTQRAKSPPPIKPRPSAHVPPPKPKNSSSHVNSSQLGIKFLRKSAENLLDIPEDNKPLKTGARPAKSPDVIPRSNTTVHDKSSTRISPNSTRKFTQTQGATIKLNDLEYCLKSNRQFTSQKRSPDVHVHKVLSKSASAQPSKKAPPPRPSNSPALNLKSYYKTTSDYHTSEEGLLSFREGAVVNVLEKSDTGWWFVSIEGDEGWVPCSYIEKTTNAPSKPNPPKPNPPRKPKPVPPKPAAKSTNDSYQAISDYDSTLNDDSGINLVNGKVYEVLEKSSGGWWFVKDGSKEGWAPSSFLERVK